MPFVHTQEVFRRLNVEGYTGNTAFRKRAMIRRFRASSASITSQSESLSQTDETHSDK